MERRELESAAANGIICGAFTASQSASSSSSGESGNLRWGPFRHSWVFIGTLLILLAGCLGIDRYYKANYGRGNP